MTALLTPVTPTVSYQLVETVEIHLHNMDLSPADLRAIRAAGGKYSECRGHESTRFVKIPGGDHALFERIAKAVRKSWKPTSKDRAIICRGPIEKYRGFMLSGFHEKLTLRGILIGAERKARELGAPCSCCGDLVPVGVQRCPECTAERARYETAARAAAAAGVRYDRAVECFAAATSTSDQATAIERVFAALGGAG